MSSPFRSALRSADLLSGVFFAGVGLGVTVISRNYELGSLARVGPGLFPMMLGILLTGIGVIIALRALPAQDEKNRVRLALRPVACLIGAVLVFMLLVERAGFAPAAFFSSALAMLASRDARPVKVLVVSTALTALSLATFILALGMPIRALAW
ncbi:tripartite tricarboxylate transporter TctB family protein [Xanthobacter dioxanivorans]|uniref:Tripartite tricarboxylate transporter TctB family protein n=1 Tax=Xanthobacter dioxanivorans TaxID=2528964 RepID=A0A974PLM2_9HYPH|nr:tripartite tricarboxylate transporter TctB family protein [Xanthobacter dioxanivorans]QRG05867.1 tripartite tricarboxylate transporter TctB family protein [Xanthobacter dioxanivorans]